MFLKFIKEKLNSSNDAGFTLIDTVVTVGVISALSMTGITSYNSIIHSAKVAATTSAATQIYSAATLFMNDSVDDFGLDDIVNDYNESAQEIRVYALLTQSNVQVIAIHKDVSTDTLPANFEEALELKENNNSFLIQTRGVS